MKTKKLQLGSIEDEAAACRKAFKSVKVGAFVLHCHHGILAETLIEDAENRIAFILKSKAQHEQALRLRLFRPVSEALLKKHKAEAERHKAYAEWHKAEAEWHKAEAERQKAYAERHKAYAERHKAEAEWHKAEADLGRLIHAQACHPRCPWNGETIFP
jgi:hypothetical protein